MNISNEEINSQVEENLPLVYWTIRNYFGAEYLVDDDVVQVGMIGLWKACKYYNTGIATFSTFAFRCISNAIKREIRNQKAKIPETFYQLVSFEDTVFLNGEDTDIELKDIISDPKDLLSDYMTKQDFQSFQNSLQENDRKLLDLLLKGFTQSNIGKELGISQPQVSRKIKHLKNKMKLELDIA